MSDKERCVAWVGANVDCGGYEPEVSADLVKFVAIIRSESRAEALEEAAKVCEVRAKSHEDDSSFPGESLQYVNGRIAEADMCAHHIRALKETP